MKSARTYSPIRRRSDRAIRLLLKIESEAFIKWPHEELMTRFCETAIDTGYRRAAILCAQSTSSNDFAILADARAVDSYAGPSDLAWAMEIASSESNRSCSLPPDRSPASHESQRRANDRDGLSAVIVTPHFEGAPHLSVVLFAGDPEFIDEAERAILEIIVCCLCSLSRLAKSEAALRMQLEQHETLLDHMCEIVYTANDEGVLTYVNSAVERILGWSKEELIGRKPVERVFPEDLKQLTKMFDSGSPSSESGMECRVQCRNGEMKTLHISAYPSPSPESSHMGIARDVTDQRRAEGQLLRAFEGTIQALGAVMVTRDPYTGSHQSRVARLAVALAREVGLSERQIDAIYYAALVHDIGKISIPSEILTKPTRLTQAEKNLLVDHPQVAYDVLKDIEFPWPIARIVLEHHERCDGSGYPHGLTRDETLIESRVLVVADVVEAMSSHRPYRPALGIPPALEEISKHSGTLYDREVVSACLRLFSNDNPLSEDIDKTG